MELKVIDNNLSFGFALDNLMMSTEKDPDNEYAIRRSEWKEDVLIKIQVPDKNSKMTHPYLYVESRYGRVPWKETMVEMFAKDWEFITVI